VVYDDQRVDTGSREEGSTDRVRLREGMRQNVGGVEGGVDSTMSPNFNSTRQSTHYGLRVAIDPHLSSSSHLTLLIRIGKRIRIDKVSQCYSTS
jgi:hypothetical protein